MEAKRVDFGNDNIIARMRGEKFEAELRQGEEGIEFEFTAPWGFAVMDMEEAVQVMYIIRTFMGVLINEQEEQGYYTEDGATLH